MLKHVYKNASCIIKLLLAKSTVVNAFDNIGRSINSVIKKGGNWYLMGVNGIIEDSVKYAGQVKGNNRSL